MRTTVHSLVADLTTTPASTPTPPHFLILQVDAPICKMYLCQQELGLCYKMPHMSQHIYIGETGRHLGDQFRQHVHSTRRPDCNLPVGRYLASLGHTSQDMLVSVIRSVFRDPTHKRSFEARMTFRQCTLHPDGLNGDFGFI